MRSLSRFACALISAALLASLTVTTTLAGSPVANVYVDDDGLGTPGSSCDGGSSIPDTIQEGVNDGSPGSTIWVCPGTYYGQVFIEDSGMRVESVQRYLAVIEPAADHVNYTDLVTIQTGTGISVRGFRIQVPTTGDCEYVASMIHVHDAPGAIVRGNKVGITGTAGLDACGYVTGIQLGGNSDGAQALHNWVTDFQIHGIYDYSAADTLIWGNRVGYLHAAYAPNANSSYGIITNRTGAGVAMIRLNTVRSLASAGTSTPKLAWAIVSTAATLDIKRNIGRNVTTFIYAQGGTSGKIKDNHGRVNVQRGLDFNQSSGVEVTGNHVEATESGVDVDSSSSANNFHDNDWDGSAPNDCVDASSGGGTANTANTWTNNYGDTSSPPGICTPAP